MEFTISKLFKNQIPLIGMIHLPALPGYPTHRGIDYVIKKAVKDLKTLEEAGFDGVLVENDNDQPHEIHVTDTTKKSFSIIMQELLKLSTIPVGMEIIYDMFSTVEVAHSVNASFIRLDIFADAIKTRWGIIPSQAKKIADLMNRLGCTIPLLTDIQVKHGTLVEQKSITQSAKDSIEWGASGLIVTGNWTGQAPTQGDCRLIKSVDQNVPLFIGSGFSAENAKKYLPLIDGVIVGTSIKTGEYIDFNKAKELEKMVHSYNI